MSTFSNNTVKLLKQAGWFEGRLIDTSSFEKLLEEKGFPLFPSITEFLSQFGGLKFTNTEAVPPAPEDWHFDIAEAVVHGSSTRVQTYGRRLGVEMCLIGEGFRGYLLLMMDEEGRVYGGYDQVLLHIGNSGIDAIGALCDGLELSPIVDSAI